MNKKYCYPSYSPTLAAQGTQTNNLFGCPVHLSTVLDRRESPEKHEAPQGFQGARELGRKGTREQKENKVGNMGKKAALMVF